MNATSRALRLGRRISLIGCGGSGKSTLARRLGSALDLPVHHLDALFWHPGWIETPKDEWRRKQESLCAGEAWIVDGNYSGTMDIRLAAADTIIFLDLPRWICLVRAFRRSLNPRGSRLDMAPGCPEKIDRTFFAWIWNYARTRRPGILAKLESLRGQKKIVILRTTREVRTFLASLAGSAHGRTIP